MTPRQNQGAGKRRAPAVPLDYYSSKREKRTSNLFFVFYNGEVTERNYFKGLCDTLSGKESTKSQFIRLKYEVGSPGRIVQYVVNAKNPQHKDRDVEITNEDIVWVVFDKDDFGEDYSSAIDLAKQNEINIAYCNECFELWLVLHFQNQETSIGRGALAEYLRTTWEDTSGNSIDNKGKIKRFPYGILHQHGDRIAAIERARQQYEKATNSNPDSPWEVNPVTTVYQLVEQLTDFFSD